MPAVAGVAVALAYSWWLALILAVPALFLLAWQAPRVRIAGRGPRRYRRAAAGRARRCGC